jgi:hypothetical protein
MNQPLTDEEYAQLVDLGGQNELLTAKQRQQLAMAQQLRDFTAPQTRSARGQIYAPGKAEAITGALGALASGYMGAKGMGMGQDMAANSQKQRALLLRGLLGQRPQQPLQPQVNPMGPYEAPQGWAGMAME